MQNRRHSKKREQILEALKSSHGTLSAASIHQKLPNLDLATIYRNLDLFVSDGTIKKLYLGDGGNEAVFEYQSEPHHHAVCNECKKVIHFTVDPKKMEKLIPEGFTANEVELVVRGTCR